MTTPNSKPATVTYPRTHLPSGHTVSTRVEGKGAYVTVVLSPSYPLHALEAVTAYTLTADGQAAVDRADGKII